MILAAYGFSDEPIHAADMFVLLRALSAAQTPRVITGEPLAAPHRIPATFTGKHDSLYHILKDTQQVKLKEKKNTKYPKFGVK